MPEPILAGKQEKGAVAPFLLERIIREPYVKQLSRHILVRCTAVFHGLHDNGSAPLCRSLILKIKDGLLTKEDEKLPFSRHVISPFEHFYFVQDFVAGVLVWTEKIVVSNP